MQRPSMDSFAGELHFGESFFSTDGSLCRNQRHLFPMAKRIRACPQAAIEKAQHCFRTFTAAACAHREVFMAADPVIPFSSLICVRQQDGDKVTVLCNGRVVSETVPILQQEVRPLIAQFNTIVLDLTSVSYMDSSGLGALVGLFVSAKRAGKQLKLLNLSARVQELLRLTTLLNVFEGYGEHL